MRTFRQFVKEEGILPAMGIGLGAGAFLSLAVAAIGPIADPSIAEKQFADSYGVRTALFVVVTSLVGALLLGVCTTLWGLRPACMRNWNIDYY